LPESVGLEFTGERVVPGLVDPNLFNEHLARYRFAARFSAHGRVLDAGCGSGYGAAELSAAADVVGMDISAEAVQHARRTFSRPRVHFLQGACESLPFADTSFDLVLAFEVIEHLERWQQLLTEARRVLRPSGALLVSTPNKAWYTESRAEAGPNPYHVHEFEYAEFRAALETVFPHVHLWTQNHAESIAFVPASSCLGVLDAPADAAPQHAHFFLAACSQSPIVDTRAFAWLPSSGNALRERQHHIALLEAEVEQKNEWLAGLHDEMDVARTLIAGLQQELKATHAGYREQVSRLESEAVVRLDWVHDLEAQIARGRAEIQRLNRETEEHRNTIDERTRWAQALDAELQDVRRDFEALQRTMLVRVGRKLKLITGEPE
jgi:ubiquinone/menaquinone biosynthesis C-methylase UbiE